jgi:exonuclease VII large subunit
MNKNIACFILALCMSLYGLSQVHIKPEEAVNHVGDSVKVCGKIYGGIYLENSKGQPTLLNMGAKYPDSPLTLVIWADARKKLTYKPEEKFKDKEVCVTGRVTLYKEKAQIEIANEEQIKEQ